MKDAKTAYFLTLTYDDEHLPLTKNGNPSLNKEHLYEFLHKLVNEGQRLWQEKLKKDGMTWKERKKIRLPIRYFAVGEYGENLDRPHYHIILFNYPADKKGMADAITKLWSKEQLIPSVLYASGKLCNYITKYMLKNDEKYLPKDVELPFRSMSKGLGKNYVSRSRCKQHVLSDDFTSNIGNSKYVLPRYLKQKLTKLYYKQYHSISENDADFYYTLGATNYKKAKEVAKIVECRKALLGENYKDVARREQLLLEHEKKQQEAKNLNYRRK